MDAARFDRLARSLTDRRSRRGALAAVVGGALGVAGLAETDAKKSCPPCKKRKKGKCKKKLPDGTPCGNGVCRAGTCAACAAGQRVCGSACVDLTTNSAHCGSCGKACGATQLCDRGTCVTGIGTCAAGANLCLGPMAPGVSCNGSCVCIPTQAGATRCVQPPLAPTEPCTADGDCAGFGPGAFCTPVVELCGTRFCVSPCLAA